MNEWASLEFNTKKNQIQLFVVVVVATSAVVCVGIRSKYCVTLFSFDFTGIIYDKLVIFLSCFHSSQNVVTFISGHSFQSVRVRAIFALKNVLS